MQPDEIHPRHTFSHAELVHGTAVCAEDRQIDPGKPGLVSSAPDHVLHIERAIVSQQRLAVAHSHDSGHALHTGIDEILRFYANQRRRFGEKLRTGFPADGIVHVQDLMADEFHDPHQEIPRQRAFDPNRNKAGFFARHPNLLASGAREFERDIRRRVPCAHDQHGTVQELRGIGIVVRVNL